MTTRTMDIISLTCSIACWLSVILLLATPWAAVPGFACATSATLFRKRATRVIRVQQRLQ